MTDEKQIEDRKRELWVWLGVPLFGLLILSTLLLARGSSRTPPTYSETKVVGKGLIPALLMYAEDNAGESGGPFPR